MSTFNLFIVCLCLDGGRVSKTESGQVCVQW